jgi:hypothetical protein
LARVTALTMRAHATNSAGRSTLSHVLRICTAHHDAVETGPVDTTIVPCARFGLNASVLEGGAQHCIVDVQEQVRRIRV